MSSQDEKDAKKLDFDEMFPENDSLGPMSATWYTDRIKAVPSILRNLSLNRITSAHALAGAVALSLIFSWRRRSLKKQQDGAPRQRLGSRDGSRSRLPSRDGTRPRLGSHEKKRSARNRERTSTEEMIPGILEDLADDGWATENGIEADHVLSGPSVSDLVYEAWSPPPSWSEASRQIVPQVTKQDIHREVKLELEHSTLDLGITPPHKGNVHDTTASSREEKHEDIRIASVHDVSVHPKTPLEGGVMELKIKDPYEEETWMEHTFASAHMAAQFQQDMLGCQVVGAQIQHMFSALELVQKGSIACEEKEFVLHDSEAPVTEEEEEDKKENTLFIEPGVAWDDAMRCFSSLPSVKATLEKQHIMSTPDLFSDQNEEKPTSLLPLYVDKRLMLGRVDFFRLFVPALSKTALPKNESEPSRMEQLLTWRKRAARASVLVRSYIRAMKVVNQGWHLEKQVPGGDAYLKRRLAFDLDDDNIKHDGKNKNEYYEATVSRDVRCDVHTPQHLTKKGANAPSSYQAYSLVGCHCFKLPPNGVNHPLLHNKDPVAALPSLRRIIESNPEVDFFVSGFFPEGPRIAILLVFCRTLPPGVDKTFDTILDRYVNGTKKVRDRKMEVFIQLGPGAGLSPLAWTALKSFSALLSWTRRGEAAIPFESGGAYSRTPFPGMTMGNYTETTHFGGSLQKDKKLPKNYVGVNAHVDGEKMGNMAARLLYQRLEDGALPASIVDFSFVLEGQELDELPERAMASIRMVHIDGVRIALPISYSASSSETLSEPNMDAVVENPPSPFTPQSSTTGQSLSWSSWLPFRSAHGDDAEAVNDMNNEVERVRDVPETINVSFIEEPYRVGVKALWEVLHGVSVPVRKEGLSPAEVACATPVQIPVGTGAPLPASVHQEDLVNFAVLRKLNANDLRRFYIASGSDLKTAAVRVVESAAWRGVTFPIDTRVCRIELQTGQFFQQGHDKDNCPVFYFQNMCLGPWRKDVDAVIAAVVHRLETSMQRLAKDNPDVQCTVIILMGRPFHSHKKKVKPEKKKEMPAEEQDEAKEESKDEDERPTWNPFAIGVNPRIDPEEDYFIHTNPTLVSKLVQLLSQHYPERLSKALVVPGKGGSGYLSMALGGTLGLRAYVPSKRTRAKVRILNYTDDLLKFIEKDQLTSFVGGEAPISPEAFECDEMNL